jgi:hypothetical protein
MYVFSMCNQIESRVLIKEHVRRLKKVVQGQVHILWMEAGGRAATGYKSGALYVFRFQVIPHYEVIALILQFAVSLLVSRSC